MPEKKGDGDQEKKQANQVSDGDVSVFGTGLVGRSASAEDIEQKSFQKMIGFTFLIKAIIPKFTEKICLWNALIWLSLGQAPQGMLPPCGLSILKRERSWSKEAKWGALA